MKSRTSFFNGALFKKNITRCLPLWVLYTVFLVITLVLPTIGGYSNEARSSQVLNQIRSWTNVYAQLVTMVYAIICAACCFGYLHKTRSTYMLHALPMTRTAMYVTNYLSGLLFAIVPNLFSAGAAMLICGSSSCTVLLLKWLLYMTLEGLFFYGLAVFCMLLCGKTAASTIIYFLLNFLAVILGSLTMTLVQPMIYGIRDGGNWYLALSPVWKLLTNSVSLYNSDVLADSLLYLVIIAAVGVVLSVLAWVMYRIRRLEAAGDMVACKAAKPVTKYLFTYLCSLCLGLFISNVLFGVESFQKVLPGVIACLLIGGFIGYFGAEMMLRKTLRVFKGETLLGFAAYAAVLAIFLLAIHGDWLGIVKYVPPADEVASVSIDTGHQDTIVLIDSADVEQVREMHMDLTSGIGREDYPTCYINLTYTLDSGKTVSRRYGTSENWLYQSGSKIKTILEDFYDRADLTQAYYDALDIPNSIVEVNHGVGNLSSRQAGELYEAMCKDIQSGALKICNSPGQRFFVDYNDDYVFSVTMEDTYTCVVIYVPPEASNTRAYLDSLVNQ